MVGLYTVDLLAVVMTILTSVDTISGEITSGTIHAIATKPISRWQVLMGKWMGFAGMVGVYVAIIFGGTIAVGYFVGRRRSGESDSRRVADLSRVPAGA